jgi:hypothetical protein
MGPNAGRVVNSGERAGISYLTGNMSRVQRAFATAPRGVEIAPAVILELMEENPYRPPVDSQRIWGTPIWHWVALGAALGLGVVITVAIAAVIAFFNLERFVDIRENPRHWDEVKAREDAERQQERRAAADFQDVG